VPAVVGSFPEPFLHGIGGKRLPTVVECAPGAASACARVSAALKAVGVPVASQLLGTGSGTDSLGVVVGTWSEVRAEVAGELIAHRRVSRHHLADELDAATRRVRLVVEDAIGRTVVQAQAARDARREVVRANVR